MKRRRKGSTVALAVGATMVMGTAGAAHAASFSLSATTAGSDSQTLSFAKFDPALGTLTGVVFTLADSATSTSAAVTLSGAEGGTAQTTVLGDFAVSTGSGTQITASGSNTASCFTTGGFECDATSAGPGTPPIFSSPVTDTTDLLTYVGPTGFFDVFVTLDVNVVPPTSCTDDNQVPTCTHSGTATWTGDLTVAFQFLNEPPLPPPTGVPEPGMLSLLGAGLVGLGARLFGRGAATRHRR